MSAISLGCYLGWVWQKFRCLVWLSVNYYITLRCEFYCTSLEIRSTLVLLDIKWTNPFVHYVIFYQLTITDYLRLSWLIALKLKTNLGWLTWVGVIVMTKFIIGLEVCQRRGGKVWILGAVRLLCKVCLRNIFYEYDSLRGFRPLNFFWLTYLKVSI